MPTSRTEFRRYAKPIPAVIGERTLELQPTEYRSGSLGWGWWDKILIKIGDNTCVVQINLTATVLGSRTLPPDEHTPEDVALAIEKAVKDKKKGRRK